MPLIRQEPLNPVMIPRLMTRMCIKTCPTETFLITPPSPAAGRQTIFDLLLLRRVISISKTALKFSKRPDHPRIHPVLGIAR